MDYMNKKIKLVCLVIALIGMGIYMSTKQTTPTIVEENTTESAQKEAPRGKLMSIESYVTQNIASLSPEKEVLGGTFMVTAIEIEPEKNTGTVKYEDGHIALVADFSYTASDTAGITITSFVIRQ